MGLRCGGVSSSPLPFSPGSIGTITTPINSSEAAAAARNYSSLAFPSPHPFGAKGGKSWFEGAAETFCNFNGSLSPKEAADAFGSDSLHPSLPFPSFFRSSLISSHPNFSTFLCAMFDSNRVAPNFTAMEDCRGPGRGGTTGRVK